MSTPNQRQRRVEKAQTRVIFTVPFFSPGVAKLPVTFDGSVPTACTDGGGIRWNPDWFDKLTDPQLVTVLVHETCHCLLGHLWRAPEGCDWDLWNQATDHAVNLMLADFGVAVTGKGLADPFPFPEPKEAFCADARFKGMAEEAIYKQLSGRPKRPQGKQPGGGQGQGQGKPAPGSMPSFGQMAKPAAKSNGAGKKMASHWANTLVQSAKLAQGQGTLPAGMERLVDALVNPRVPWWELLRSLLRETAVEDWDFLKPAPEYDETGFLMPSLESERCGPIVFATDTSGSIDQATLAQFQTEKQECLDSLRPKVLVDIYCDASIHKVEEYSPGDRVKRQCPGGGGTDFRPVFRHIEKMAEPVKALVYLTDLYGSFPTTAPEYPVIWVTWSKGQQAPFGETVYAGE